MDLDELQTVKSRERQTDSLQQLRDSFYTEASEYLQELRDARDEAAERADDPWNDPEVGRLSDEIETAEQTVEAIHKRRVAKIVKNASLAAHGSAVDDSGLTTEEQGMFEQLVADIEANREHVLDKIAGELPADSAPESPHTAPAAGASAESSPTAATSGGGKRPETEPADAPPDGIDADDGTSRDDEQTVPAADVMNDGGSTRAADPATATPADPNVESPPSADASRRSAQADGVDRRTVRITEEVGEILGVDQREYDLSADDVVTLPEANAKPLLEQDAAQQLD